MADTIINTINANIPLADTDNNYTDSEGLLHCGKCKDKIETYITFNGFTKKVRCICSCIKEQQAKEKEYEHQEQIKRNKSICFNGNTQMYNWRFENDIEPNSKMSKAMQSYCDSFKEDFLINGTGLLLYGSVGTGKTFYASCIANRLIENDYTALVTNFATISNELDANYQGKADYINALNKYDLLILDDLGIERKSEYMQEQVFNVIDSRYRTGKPLIITTNLTGEELKSTKTEYTRIYDRILERCYPLNIEGQSIRRQKLNQSAPAIKNTLGL